MSLFGASREEVDELKRRMKRLENIVVDLEYQSKFITLDESCVSHLGYEGYNETSVANVIYLLLDKLGVELKKHKATGDHFTLEDKT